MTVWDEYPSTYRQREIAQICAAVRAGDCVSLVGLSGAGKSNLLGFLAHRVSGDGLARFALADCNRLSRPGPAEFFTLLAEALDEEVAPETITLRALEGQISARLASGRRLCLLIDRFDAIRPEEAAGIAGSLRALRDRFKYDLTYVIGSRRPLDPSSELAELFYASTLWLGPLSPADARWSAARYAERRGAAWDETTLTRLIEFSSGYPSLLRAACEAAAAGCRMDLDSLRAHPAVQHRAAEFWADQPSPQELAASGLQGQPLLAQTSPILVDPAGLTAAEQRLLEFLQAHAGTVCIKDELIRAVWPEDAAAAGLRDDSLAQLIHRLRDKIGTRFIQTVPGRGYRFNP